MSRLWLFYPQHDMALAANRAGYTPSAAANNLFRAGQALPLWLGEPGDAFICDGINAAWYQSTVEKYGLQVTLWDHNPTGYTPFPWGWSLSAREEFLQRGFTPDALPGDAALARIRTLSHRRTALLTCKRLCHRDVQNSGVGLHHGAADHHADNQTLAHQRLDASIIPLEVFSKPDLIAACHNFGRAVVKSPWSSSGRGITFVNPYTPPTVFDRLEGTIRKQGSLLVERYYDRAIDFAMLFDYADGKAQFVGLSLFHTDDRGAYCGNVVDSQDAIKARILRHTDEQTLNTVRLSLQTALQDVLKTDYSGPVGIDMLISTSGELHPCVEVNLRYTMGFVALRLHQHFPFPALFSIQPSSPNHHTPITNPSSSANISLTPPNPYFTFLLSPISHNLPTP